MKKLLIVLSIFTLVFSLFVGCSNNQENVVENAKANESMNTEPKEEVKEEPIVIAGTVSITRILHGLNVELTAVPSTSKFMPEDVLSLPQIGMAMSPDIEIIKSFEPDYFITDTTLQERLGGEFEEQQIPTFYKKTSGYEDIITTINELGAEFNKEEEAKKMVADIRAYEAEAANIYEGQDSLKVVVIFGTPGSFMLATEKSYVGGLVTMIGSENITSGLEGAMGPFIPFSLEVVADIDPDVILRLTHVNPEQSKLMFDKEFNENEFYKALSAVKNNRVYDLDNSLFGVVATVDCGQALVEMSRLLYEK